MGKRMLFGLTFVEWPLEAVYQRGGKSMKVGVDFEREQAIITAARKISSPRRAFELKSPRYDTSITPNCPRRWEYLHSELFFISCYSIQMNSWPLPHVIRLRALSKRSAAIPMRVAACSKGSAARSTKSAAASRGLAAAGSGLRTGDNRCRCDGAGYRNGGTDCRRRSNGFKGRGGAERSSGRGDIRSGKKFK